MSRFGCGGGEFYSLSNQSKSQMDRLKSRPCLAHHCSETKGSGEEMRHYCSPASSNRGGKIRQWRWLWVELSPGVFDKSLVPDRLHSCARCPSLASVRLLECEVTRYCSKRKLSKAHKRCPQLSSATVIWYHIGASEVGERWPPMACIRLIKCNNISALLTRVLLHGTILSRDNMSLD